MKLEVGVGVLMHMGTASGPADQRVETSRLLLGPLPSGPRYNGPARYNGALQAPL